MDMKSERPKRQDNALSSLNVAIEATNITREVLSITPAKAVCGSVSVVLTMIGVRFLLVRLIDCGLKHIQDSMINEMDYIELGLACAEVCTILGRGMDGKKLDDLSQSVCEAIAQLTVWVELTMLGLDHLLKMLQNCSEDPREGHQTEQTKCSLSAPSCEE